MHSFLFQLSNEALPLARLQQALNAIPHPEHYQAEFLQTEHFSLAYWYKGNEQAHFLDGNQLVLGDIRLDNRPELLRHLQLSSESSDAEIVLAAYRQWKADSPKYLIGDYSFIVWTASEGIFCARDHIGTIPLYYAEKNDQIIVSTAIAPFLVLDKFVTSQSALEHYLVNHQKPLDADTFYEGIQRLLPAHSLQITGAKTQTQAYWHPSQIAPLAPAPIEDYVEQLRELLLQALICRLNPNERTSTHLSSGLDSSGVTAIAHQYQNITAYSWSPEIGALDPLLPHDERLLIQHFADSKGLPCYFMTGTEAEYRAFFQRDIRLETATNLFSEKLVLAHAASHGIQRILSGWGGDEGVSFSHNGYLPELFLRGKWFDLVKILYRFQKRNLKGHLRLITQDIILPLLPNALYQRFTAPTAPHFLTHNPPKHFEQKIRKYPTVRQNRIALYENGHISARMEGWYTWALPYGIRYAYPLTDRRLLEFVYGLPNTVLLQGTYTRSIFRKALDPFLSAEIVWRRSKFDPALEAHRLRLNQAIWRQFAHEFEADLWSNLPDWMDRAAVRAKFLPVPEPVQKADLYTLQQVMKICEIIAIFNKDNSD